MRIEPLGVRDITVKPKAYLLTFWPDEPLIGFRIPIQGRYIAVLNDYFPNNMKDGLYSTFVSFRESVEDPQTADGGIKGEIVPLFGKVEIETDFNEFFITQNPQPFSTPFSAMTWTLNREVSTPIKILVSDEKIHYSASYLNDVKDFVMCFETTLPVLADQVGVLGIDHGPGLKRLRLGLFYQGLVNAIDMIASPVNDGTFDGIQVTPSTGTFYYTSPYENIADGAGILDRDSKLWEFPYVERNRLLVLVTGGGVGETGVLQIRFYMGY